jgi:hypothetical protein
MSRTCGCTDPDAVRCGFVKHGPRPFEDGPMESCTDPCPCSCHPPRPARKDESLLALVFGSGASRVQRVAAPFLRREDAVAWARTHGVEEFLTVPYVLEPAMVETFIKAMMAARAAVPATGDPAARAAARIVKAITRDSPETGSWTWSDRKIKLVDWERLIEAVIREESVR